MTLRIVDRPPLEERVITHRLHMADLEIPVQHARHGIPSSANSIDRGRYGIVVFQGIPFFVAETWFVDDEDNVSFHVYGSAPFFDGCDYSIISALSVEALRQYTNVAFIGFSDDVSDRLLEQWSQHDIQSPQAKKKEHLYQKLKPSKEHERRLRRFSKTGFTCRELKTDDFAAVEAVYFAWANRKVALDMHALRDLVAAGVTASQLEVRGWPDVGPNCRNAYNSYVSRRHFDAMLVAPHYRVLGCFKDNELVGYSFFSGTGDFYAFEYGSFVPGFRKSPLEFLDLSIMRDITQDRDLVVVDWGRAELNSRGLLEYKQKFGETACAEDRRCNLIRRYS